MEKIFYKIKQCKSEEEVRKLIDIALEEANSNSKSGLTIGYNKDEEIRYHKGFINKDTRIRYCKTSVETYGMGTTDYFYEFAIKVWKDAKINNPYMFMRALQEFLIDYFGEPRFDKDYRENFFLWKAGFYDYDDKKYFENIKKLTIGDLKDQGLAMCSERAAVAQNILSLFNFESYFTIGIVRHDDKEEPHAFNIVKSDNGYALLDFSVPVRVKMKNGRTTIHPFQGVISEDKIKGFLDQSVIIDFQEYEIDETIPAFIPIDGKRKYIVTYEDLKIEPDGMQL